MSMFDEKIIWFVDEDLRDLRTYAEALALSINEATTDTHIQVRSLLALPNQEDYVKYFNSVNTVSVILDQRLKETGKVSYTGIELAKFLRNIYPKLPIFILTAFKEDREAFDGEEWNVESIFSKDLLSGASSNDKLVVQRILRHIDVHQNIIEQRESRFMELLQKSLGTDLDGAELQELETLRNERTIGLLVEEVGQVTELTRKLQELERIEQSIRELTQKVGGNATST